MKRLFIAMVDHKVVPGTKPVVFFQDSKPKNSEIKARFADIAEPSELQVVGFFELNPDSLDVESQAALVKHAEALELAKVEELMRAGKWPPPPAEPYPLPEGYSPDAPRFFMPGKNLMDM